MCIDVELGFGMRQQSIEPAFGDSLIKPEGCDLALTHIGSFAPIS